MNLKKLYVLYFVLVISIVWAMLASVFSADAIESFKDGYRSAGDVVVNEDGKNYREWSGMVFSNDPKMGVEGTIICGTLSDTSAQIICTPEEMKVSIINTDKLPGAFHYYNTGLLITSILVSVSVIVMLVLLYKLLRRMKKALKAGMAFSMDVARVLRSLGIVLISMDLLASLTYYFHNQAVQTVIEPYGYQVQKIWDTDFISIIFGIALLLVAEFLKIGYKMQEEQSLTV